MTQVETLLTEAVEKRGFVGVRVQVRRERNRYLTYFDTVDRIGFPLDTYEVFGECVIDDMKVIDFIASQISRRLVRRFTNYTWREEA